MKVVGKNVGFNQFVQNLEHEAVYTEYDTSISIV